MSSLFNWTRLVRITRVDTVARLSMFSVSRSRLCTQASSGQPAKKRGLLAWYNGWLEKSPVLTKSITSGVLFGLGDVIAQFASGGLQTQFDGARCLRASAFGCFLLGPLAHLHFNFLEWLVVRRLAVSTRVMPFAKMFIEQFTYWAPGINVIYHFSLGMMEGKGIDGSIQRVKDKIIPTMKANYMLWPAVQIINFKFVPVAHQLNLILIVSLGWAAFLSRLSAADDANETPDEQQ
ncbi:uncharacterized protein LOC134187485 [Corticium candelabrum]|uniref:uncharacterized protein LOC134187485 n=1 Tax=Corticium candelabrum TaxID=121492 RepID=UPI002E26C220|nr:uncharacterized protein LOC134187485 [Corticium candelabrum]